MRGALPLILGCALLTVGGTAHGTAQLIMLSVAIFWFCGAGYLAVNELFGGTVHERVLRKVTHRPLPKGEPLYAQRRADEHTIKALERELRNYAHGECPVVHRSEQAMLRCKRT